MLWAGQIQSNWQLLKSVENDPFALALIAMCVTIALTMHVALPLAPGRAGVDMIAYTLAVLAHAVCTPLPAPEAMRFGALLGLGLVVVTLLRATHYLTYELLPATATRPAHTTLDADSVYDLLDDMVAGKPFAMSP